MPDSDPAPPTGPDTATEPALTDMESFFDNLFNHHMVLPQPPETPTIEGGDSRDAAAEDHHRR